MAEELDCELRSVGAGQKDPKVSFRGFFIKLSFDPS